MVLSFAVVLLDLNFEESMKCVNLSIAVSDGGFDGCILLVLNLIHIIQHYKFLYTLSGPSPIEFIVNLSGLELPQ